MMAHLNPTKTPAPLRAPYRFRPACLLLAMLAGLMAAPAGIPQDLQARAARRPVEAYFVLACLPARDLFIIRVTDPRAIDHARRIIARRTRTLLRVGGRIVRQ